MLSQPKECHPLFGKLSWFRFPRLLRLASLSFFRFFNLIAVQGFSPPSYCGEQTKGFVHKQKNRGKN